MNKRLDTKEILKNKIKAINERNLIINRIAKEITRDLRGMPGKDMLKMDGTFKKKHADFFKRTIDRCNNSYITTTKDGKKARLTNNQKRVRVILDVNEYSFWLKVDTWYFDGIGCLYAKKNVFLCKLENGNIKPGSIAYADIFKAPVYTNKEIHTRRLAALAIKNKIERARDELKSCIEGYEEFIKGEK